MRQTIHRGGLLGLPLVLFQMAAAPAPAEAQWDDRDWCRGSDRHCEVREFTLDTRDGRLSVNARPNGSIRVEGWDGSEVRVEARVTARARSDGAAEELAQDVEIRVESGRIESDGPRTRGRESWSVDYRVRVPFGTDLELQSTNGSVAVSGVRGGVEARTTNGSVRLEDVAGPIRARSTNGAIQASFVGAGPLRSDMELRTTNGSVTLGLPEGLGARLEASTTNGGITTDFPITVQGRIGRRLSGVVGDGGPEIRMATTNGAIRIRRN
jgi:hypothetical protein